MFSITYGRPAARFHPISFQNYGAGRFASSGMRDRMTRGWLSIPPYFSEGGVADGD
jgi:hypothetical protein